MSLTAVAVLLLLVVVPPYRDQFLGWLNRREKEIRRKTKKVLLYRHTKGWSRK